MFTQNSHKLEDGVAQPLYVVVRRVYRVREAEEAPIREAADRGLDAEERTQLIQAIRECIAYIVSDVTRRQGGRTPTARELAAICILAKKVFLAHDYNRLAVDRREGAADVIQWQLDYLQLSGWQPCEFAQRKFAELPPVLARKVDPALRVAPRSWSMWNQRP